MPTSHEYNAYRCAWVLLSCSLSCKRACCPAHGHATLLGLCGREEVLVTLAAVSDFSFAWGLLEPYTAALQAQVVLSSLDHTLHASTSIVIRSLMGEPS